jgi:hypothetical protein
VRSGEPSPLSPDPLYPLLCSAGSKPELRKPSRRSRWSPTCGSKISRAKGGVVRLDPRSWPLFRRISSRFTPPSSLRLERNHLASRHHARRLLTFKGTSSRSGTIHLERRYLDWIRPLHRLHPFPRSGRWRMISFAGQSLMRISLVPKVFKSKRYVSLEICGEANLIQHFTVLRFLPIAPLSRALWIYSNASGTLQAVSPMSTETWPTFAAACTARSLSPCT